MFLLATVLAGCGGDPSGPTGISRTYRTERRAIKELLKGIGAIPTVPGGGGGGEEPA